MAEVRSVNERLLTIGKTVYTTICRGIILEYNGNEESMRRKQTKKQGRHDHQQGKLTTLLNYNYLRNMYLFNMNKSRQNNYAAELGQLGIASFSAWDMTLKGIIDE